MSDLTAPVRVGVIGAGYFGCFHYDAWSRMPEAALIGAFDRDPARAEAVATEYGCTAFESVAALLEAGPDLIDITAPPAAHLDLIRAVAPHAKAIICQKPFCDGLEGAREAIALAEHHGTRLAVHENIRFQPWNREARALIEAGRLGTLYQISFRLRPGDGRGPDAYLARQPYFQRMPRFLVHETAVHWIDTFRYLAGEVSGVFARLTRLNPAIAGEDAGMILFEFEGGTRGVFDGNRLADHAASNRRRTLGEMMIEGSTATLRLDGEGRLWLRDFGSNEETQHRFDWHDHLFGGDCVYECNRHILSCWLAGQPSEMDATTYIRNQIVEEAIYESAKTGRHIQV
ncbi:MAG: Gfo/Idh/MocA family oxidoreductase [Pseudomonadota bacterium]